jgi:hypothetical protein
MAKNKRKKRGWSGAPPARSAATRTAGARAGASGGGSAPTSTPTDAGSTDPALRDRATRTGSGARAATTDSPVRPSSDRGDLAPRSAPGAPAASPAASNRLARKEEARRQREALRRKAQRRRQLRRGGIIAAVVLAVGGVAALLVFSGGGGGGLKQVDPHDLAGIQTGPAPWGPEIDHLPDRLNQMGLPPLGGEALAYHIHQNLVVDINGTQQVVPFGLGYISSTSLAEIHTHSSSGTIHVEAGANRHFTLGDVFDIWGVLFTKNQIGSYKVHGQDRIRVYVNGKLDRGDPTKIPLRDAEVIVLTYGTAAQVPSPMPAVFRYEQAPLPASSATPTPSASGS